MVSRQACGSPHEAMHAQRQVAKYVVVAMLPPAGVEALDTGRFYAHAAGNVARQTIKLCPGIAGTAASNDVAALQKLPHGELRAKDAFGRTAPMLAALHNSWTVLQWLIELPDAIDWSETQSTQARLALHAPAGQFCLKQTASMFRWLILLGVLHYAYKKVTCVCPFVTLHDVQRYEHKQALLKLAGWL